MSMYVWHKIKHVKIDKRDGDFIRMGKLYFCLKPYGHERSRIISSLIIWYSILATRDKLATSRVR